MVVLVGTEGFSWFSFLCDDCTWDGNVYAVGVSELVPDLVERADDDPVDDADGFAVAVVIVVVVVFVAEDTELVGVVVFGRATAVDEVRLVDEE